MTGLSLAPVLFTGCSLGMLHALDPDHLMTITTLSARTDETGASVGRSATLRYAALWALGHGGLLVLIAMAAFLLGWTLPAVVPQLAERSVGLILIAAGAALLWLRHPPHGQALRLREKVPFAVGVVHGLAGSAAMLALVPIALYQPLMAVVYALVFSLGVLAGMMLFALALGRAQLAMAQQLPGLAKAFRLVLGLGALGMGTFWLAAA